MFKYITQPSSTLQTIFKTLHFTLTADDVKFRSFYLYTNLYISGTYASCFKNYHILIILSLFKFDKCYMLRVSELPQHTINST